MKYDRSEPQSSNNYQEQYARLIVTSHRQIVGRELLTEDPIGQSLYEAPFVVLAHDGSADPVFFYANLTAQRLFEMTWQDMVRLHSRLSAEPLAQTERQRLLDKVSQRGWIGDYRGVRISASGRRFEVSNATVWNLVDASGRPIGQAAAFSEWAYLPD